MSKTAKSVLTTSAYWVGPTAPLGSGGAYIPVVGPGSPPPIPSKPAPSAGAEPVPGVDWITGSCALDEGTGSPFFGSFSFFLSGAGAGAGARSRSGGDTS